MRVSTCLLLVAAAASFKTKWKSSLRIPGYSRSEVECAGCEAFARELEEKMQHGAHKTDSVSRLGML